MKSIARFALLFIFLTGAGGARADFQYDYYLSLQGSVNPTGTCVSGISLEECNLVFQSGSAPFPGFHVGSPSNAITMTYTAVDGHVTAVTGSRAEFAIAPAPLGLYTRIPLLTYYLKSDGQLVVRDCPPEFCFQANSWALPVQLQVTIRDNILVEIPSELDGHAVSVKFEMPVTAFGDGSSHGAITTRLGAPPAESLEFGHLNFDGGFWDVSERITFEFSRGAGDVNRLFSVPFFFNGDFRSSTNNGPGYVNSLSSVGLIVSSPEGVTISSESGFLDQILALRGGTVSPVPEVESFSLMGVGLLALGLRARQRRRAS